jgi:hypothetical protein
MQMSSSVTPSLPRDGEKSAPVHDPRSTGWGKWLVWGYAHSQQATHPLASSARRTHLSVECGMDAARFHRNQTPGAWVKDGAAWDAEHLCDTERALLQKVPCPGDSGCGDDAILGDTGRVGLVSGDAPGGHGSWSCTRWTVKGLTSPLSPCMEAAPALWGRHAAAVDCLRLFSREVVEAAVKPNPNPSYAHTRTHTGGGARRRLQPAARLPAVRGARARRQVRRPRRFLVPR